MLNKFKLESERGKMIRLLEDTKLCFRVPQNIEYTRDILKGINDSWRNAVPKLEEAKNILENLLKEIVKEIILEETCCNSP